MRDELRQWVVLFLSDQMVIDVFHLPTLVLNSHGLKGLPLPDRSPTPGEGRGGEGAPAAGGRFATRSAQTRRPRGPSPGSGLNPATSAQDVKGPQGFAGGCPQRDRAPRCMSRHIGLKAGADYNRFTCEALINHRGHRY